MTWVMEPHREINNDDFQDKIFADDDFPIVYPLVMTNIAIENHHVIAGKIHYFYGHFQ